MTEPLVLRLEEAWNDVAELCDGLTDDQWITPTDCPGWSVFDNVAHMIGTERMLAGEQPTVFGDGKQSRDFTYIDNVVSANLLAIKAPATEAAGIRAGRGPAHPGEGRS